MAPSKPAASASRVIASMSATVPAASEVSSACAAGDPESSPATSPGWTWSDSPS